MRSKKVMRHWCDFCNKAGLQAHAMAQHERHCTMNPARACRVCGILGGVVEPNPDALRGMIALLPAGPEPGFGDEMESYIAEVAAAMPKLREAADNCPACILAALRQACVPVPLAEFDFKAEMSDIFASMDEQRGYGY